MIHRLLTKSAAFVRHRWGSGGLERRLDDDGKFHRYLENLDAPMSIPRAMVVALGLLFTGVALLGAVLGLLSVLPPVPVDEADSKLAGVPAMLVVIVGLGAGIFWGGIAPVPLLDASIWRNPDHPFSALGALIGCLVIAGSTAIYGLSDVAPAIGAMSEWIVGLGGVVGFVVLLWGISVARRLRYLLRGRPRR